MANLTHDAAAIPEPRRRRVLTRVRATAGSPLGAILGCAAIAVPPLAIVFARYAGATWPAALGFGALGVLAVYLSSRAPTTEAKAAELGRGVVVSVILTIALAWVQHQGELRSARENLSLSLTSAASFVGIDLHDRPLDRFYLAHKNFTDADLHGASLEQATLLGSRLRNANLAHANLGRADLEEADLRAAVLHGADLGGADLSLARLGDADLSDANLRRADLEGADLSRANLRGADLRGANLAGADLRLAILSANLSGTVFGVDFRHAKLAGVVLAGATWDSTTRWPPGFDPAAAARRAERPGASPSGPATARADVVASVVDGDTLVLQRLGPVRLLGVDAPQAELGAAQCFGTQSADDLRRLLEAGTAVRYTLGVPAHDKFERSLAYLWTADGRLVNQALLAGGDARVLLVPPNLRYAYTLRLTAARAAAAGRGLWSAC